MNHETRIKNLEKELAQLKEEIKALMPSAKSWISLSQAFREFDISPSVIRKKIVSGQLVHLKDWKKNGRKFLVNPQSIQKIQ